MLLRLLSVIMVTIVLAFSSNAEAAKPKMDKPGSQDHPMFSRLSGYVISQHKVTEFDRGVFYDGKQRINAEGKTYKISYRSEDSTPERSILQILRNYSNAFTQIGGRVTKEDNTNLYMTLQKNGSEVWVKVACSSPRQINLLIVESGEMKQELSAKDIFDSLERDGHIALYINFDIGKATIKPDSDSIIDQAATMLKRSNRLRVRIEGHTDNTGDPAGNLRLSEMRANAVKQAMIQRGVSAGKLESAGFGRDNPVADNSTDEGRAKNRRVELVRID